VLRVLRLSPGFEPPASALAPRFAGANPVGGVQIHTAHLTRALDARGVAHAVLTRRAPTAPVLARFGRHAHVVRVDAPAAMALVAPALAWRAEVVHVHFTIDLALVPIAVAIARMRGVPLVATIHCSLRHTLEVGDAQSRAIQRRGGALERWLQRQADAVITLTPRLRDLLAADGVDAAKLHVIPSGVDPARFPPAAPDPWPEMPHPRLLFVGRLEPEKDAETLLRAAARSRHRVHVALVGDGSRRAALAGLARRFGIDGRVHLGGYVPHADLPAILAHGDVLVQPSRMEELGTAVVEAMYSGLPVVASAVGGIPVRDGEEGLRVPAGDPGAFAAAIDRLLDDRALAARLGAAGRERARREHDWRALAPRVLNLYEALRGAGRARGRAGAGVAP
jgi:glycosyltransferase involved in cell wall biosynthesis